MEKTEALKKISKHFSISEEELIDALKPVKKSTTSKAKDEPSKKPKNTPEKSVGTPKKKKSESLTPKNFIFLKEDYDHLIHQMDKIVVEINRLGQDIGASCDESETFHDNFDYEELGRQKEMWIHHLRKIKKTQENALIIKPNSENNVVSIGKKFRAESSSGKVIEKFIGSYLTFNKDHISYLSPLAKQIIGKKIGDSFVSQNQTEIYVIKEIT